MKPTIITSAVALAMLTLATPSYADRAHHDVRMQTMNQPLDIIKLDGDNIMKLSVGFGSGAFHAAGDDRHVVYTVTDRGVNIDCEEDIDILGMDVCTAGKIFLDPAFSPSIYKFQRSPRLGWQSVETIKLKDADGRAISGLPNPLRSTDTELAFDKSGETIALDPQGLDTEGLIRMADGSFWLVEEYAPSLLHVAATGEVLTRLVPEGVAADLAGANYKVEGRLPDILKKRKLNRGIESIAVSPDEAYLYFMLQSPLANPNSSAYKKSRHVRLFKFHVASEQVVGEWIYPLDLPESFIGDASTKQSDVKISELVATKDGKLIVLERISQVTKLYQVELPEQGNILGSKWDDVTTAPSLEQTADLSAVGVQSLVKELLLDSASDYPGILPSKIEGVAVMNDRTMLLVNDNDFGITGDEVRFVELELRGKHRR